MPHEIIHDAEEPQAGEENFEEMLRRYEDNSPQVRKGNIVHGQVVKIGPDSVALDIGYKYEGLAPASEFTDERGRSAVNIGDDVPVLIVGTDSEGLPLLSKKGAEQVEHMNRLKEAYERGETISGTILRRIKGGFIADVGMEAFLPASQTDTAPVKNFDQWSGKQCDFKIVRLDSKTRNVVVSRRAAIEEDLEARRRERMEQIEHGQVLTGNITNITDFGVFVDLEGLVGLVRRPDVAWGPSRHPSEHYHVGDSVSVKVLDFDKEKMRVRLGIRQLLPNPWDVIKEKYPVGAVIEGRIKNITDFGLFIGILEGIDGLVHVSNLSWHKPVKPLRELYQPGDTVQAMILEVDRPKHQVSLGIKQISENPWPRLEARYRPGTHVKATVLSISESGVIVELEDQVTGLIPKSELPRQTGTEPAELSLGDSVEAEILEVLPQEHKIRLSARRTAQSGARTKLTTLGEALHEQLEKRG